MYGLFLNGQTSDFLNLAVHVCPAQSYLTDSYFNKSDHDFELHIPRKKVFMYKVNINSITHRKHMLIVNTP